MKLLTNSRSLLTTALTSSLLLAGVWAAAESGSDTLAAIDRNTNLLDNDVSMVSTMITESTNDGVEKNIVRMFRRDRDDTFLILFQEPENIRGQGYLQIDETLCPGRSIYRAVPGRSPGLSVYRAVPGRSRCSRLYRRRIDVAARSS